MARKIRSGDKVIVITGGSAGKSGVVKSVSGDRAVIDGVNVSIKNIKPSGDRKGSIEAICRSIHVSNLAHVTPEGKPDKVSFKTKDGVKYLVSKKDGREIRRA